MRTILIALSFAIVAPVHAGVPGNLPAQGGMPPPLTLAEVDMMHAHLLHKLRDEALRQKKADGGSLSAASLARLQAKLDALNAGHARRVRDTDPS